MPSRFVDVVAGAVSHNDMDVCVAATKLLVAIRQTPAAAIEVLANYAQSPPKEALTRYAQSPVEAALQGWVPAHVEGRLLTVALQLLVIADDRRWLPSCVAALNQGWFDAVTLYLLMERDAPYCAELLQALRPHILSGSDMSLLPHEPHVVIPRLLKGWGPEAVAAAPELAELPEDLDIPDWWM